MIFEMESVKPGEKIKDLFSEVEVVAVVGEYAMLRRENSKPFIATLKKCGKLKFNDEFRSKFLNKKSQIGE